MACGTGKTLTALFIRERLAAERTLEFLLVEHSTVLLAGEHFADGACVPGL
jgi:predicted helicase